MLDLDLLEAVTATTKRGEKEALLVRQPETAKEIFKRVCSPDITFGVTVDEATAVGHWHGFDKTLKDYRAWWDVFVEMLDKLAARQLTGNAALSRMENVLRGAPSEQHCRWGARIINRDLRAGIKLATVNKVWKGLVPKFSVALAHKLADYKKPLSGKWLFEPKIDGLRCVIIGGKAYTRNGKPIQTADHVLAELPSTAGDFVLDGELLGQGYFEDTISQIKNGKKADENAHKLVFNTFDAVRLDEWSAKKTRHVLERKNDLVSIGLASPHIKVVPWQIVENPTLEQVQAVHDEYVFQGYEGLMLKAEAGYDWKRSNSVLKMKVFQDFDLPIVGFVEGEGKYSGMLGTILVDDHGIVSEVGTGFSDAQRRVFWENRPLLLGRVCSGLYQNKTKEGKLRIGVFKEIRGDKDAADEGSEDEE